MPFNGRLHYRILQILGQSIFTPVWPMSVLGRRNIPRRGGVVAISNHQSFLDLIFLGEAIHREITYVARDTLWKSLGYRALTWPFRFVRLRRWTADLASVRDGVERLRRGELLLMFPEGTRTRTGEVGPFSLGFFLMARRAGAAILPMRISGSFEAWPRWRVLPSPGRIRLEVFPPLDATSLSEEQVLGELQRTYGPSAGPRLTHEGGGI